MWWSFHAIFIARPCQSILWGSKGKGCRSVSSVCVKPCNTSGKVRRDLCCLRDGIGVPHATTTDGKCTVQGKDRKAASGQATSLCLSQCVLHDVSPKMLCTHGGRNEYEGLDVGKSSITRYLWTGRQGVGWDETDDISRHIHRRHRRRSAFVQHPRSDIRNGYARSFDVDAIYRTFTAFHKYQQALILVMRPHRISIVAWAGTRRASFCTPYTTRLCRKLQSNFINCVWAAASLRGAEETCRRAPEISAFDLANRADGSADREYECCKAFWASGRCLLNVESFRPRWGRDKQRRNASKNETILETIQLLGWSRRASGAGHDSTLRPLYDLQSPRTINYPTAQPSISGWNNRPSYGLVLRSKLYGVWGLLQRTYILARQKGTELEQIPNCSHTVEFFRQCSSYKSKFSRELPFE